MQVKSTSIATGLVQPLGSSVFWLEFPLSVSTGPAQSQQPADVDQGGIDTKSLCLMCCEEASVQIQRLLASK